MHVELLLDVVKPHPGQRRSWGAFWAFPVFRLEIVRGSASCWRNDGGCAKVSGL